MALWALRTTILGTGPSAVLADKTARSSLKPSRRNRTIALARSSVIGLF